MKRSPIALIVTSLLFALWIVWLGTEALRHSKPVVVSRAQLLTAQYDVVADVSAGTENRPDPSVRVQAVLAGGEGGPAPSQTINVRNLGDTQGFAGNGTYVLPLVKRGTDYWVADLPYDPGFPRGRSILPRIYPWTQEVQKQFQAIRQER